MPPGQGRRFIRRRRHPVPTWPRRQPVRWIRDVLQRRFVFPLLWVGYSHRVYGADRLDGIRTPCLVIANHNLHLDQSLLVKSLPLAFRKRLAIAAAASDIYGNRVRGFIASVLGNGFPFNKQGSGVRESLETVAQMLEDGWHVLIFPEGKLTELGPMQPFKSGAGLLAVETGAPVVPMRLDIVRRGFREGGWLPIPRGKVEVHIGPLVEIPPGVGYAEATRLLEEAVREA